MYDTDRAGISLAFGIGSPDRIVLHNAIHRPSKARVELHDSRDDRRISRPKKASRRRDGSDAVDVVEYTVAEHAVVHEIVRNGE